MIRTTVCALLYGTAGIFALPQIPTSGLPENLVDYGLFGLVFGVIYWLMQMLQRAWDKNHGPNGRLVRAMEGIEANTSAMMTALKLIEQAQQTHTATLARIESKQEAA